ncbi:hypothetical protein [Streptomyces sp. NPDC050388]|uniref:hypothetical protein n=1 Tax=Streptomyces sp. NPDC050388 TaxID=3155781 RepID=UPI0034260EC1
MNEEMTRYHWVLSLADADGNRLSLDGMVDVDEYVASRREIYASLLRGVKEEYGLRRTTTLFFSLERDALEGGR